MHVERLDVGGYGRLPSGSFDFDPRLTLITGPNEAGKSTLHDLVVHALFGFSPDERRRRGGVSVKDWRAPWDGRPFATTMFATLTDGRRVRVHWDYAADRVEVRDADTGTPVGSPEQLGQRHDFTVGPTLMQMTRAEFEQVCCLYQRAADPVHATEPLRLALQTAVESGAGADTGVESADVRLRALLSRIGVHAGHYGPIASGRLRQRELRRDELTGQLAQARSDREALGELADELSTLEAHATDLEDLQLDLAQASLRTRAQGLGQRARRADALTHAAATAPPSGESIPVELGGRVASQREAIDNLRAAVDTLISDADAAAPAVAEARRETARLQRSIDELEPYADIDPADEEEVRSLVADRRALRRADDEPAEGDPSAPERDPLLERFRAESSRLRQVGAAADARRWRPMPLALAAILAALAVAGAALVHPAGAVLVVAAIAIAATARPRVDASLEEALAPFGGRSLEELERAAQEEDHRFIAHEAARDARIRERGNRQETRDEVDARLRDVLAAHAGADGDLGDRAAGYLVGCERRRDRDGLRVELADARGTLETLSAHDAALVERRRDLAAAESQLRGLYIRAGITDSDPELAGRRFDAALHAQAADDAAREAANRAAAQLAEVLGDATLEGLHATRARAEQELREHVAAHGERDAGAGAAQGDERLDEVRRELSDARSDVAALAARLDTLSDACADVAELEVELHGVRTELTELARVRDAARIAREALSDAAQETHRLVAPHLNAALQRSLPRLTRGRYARTTVDEDLTIMVEAPETGALVSVEQLSRGTRDQVALVERLEIARLLDPTAGVAPLLLDDPFAHFDSARIALGAQLLAEIATDRQVMLFTEDADVIAAVRAASPGCRVIELSGPPVVELLEEQSLAS